MKTTLVIVIVFLGGLLLPMANAMAYSDGNYGKGTYGSSPAPAVNISESTLSITEGNFKTYTVTLATTPSNQVDITITSSNDQISTNLITLSFTASNTPQTVTVTATDDTSDDGDLTAAITHSATSLDADYSGITIGTILVTAVDNDDSAGGGGGSSGGGSSGGGSSGGGGGSQSDEEAENSSSDDVSANDKQTTTSLPARVAIGIPVNFRFQNDISYLYPAGNIASDVMQLERFLNAFEGENLVVDGIYSGVDLEAVKRFQLKYRREILDIWSLNYATGYVGITTRFKLNFLLNGQTAQCPVFTEYHGGKSDAITFSPQIGELQKILRDFDLYAGLINNTWSPTVRNALVLFQQKFHEVMLDPWNISVGTGRQYKTTNKFLNYIVGCDTDAVNLEGVGLYDF